MYLGPLGRGRGEDGINLTPCTLAISPITGDTAHFEKTHICPQRRRQVESSIYCVTICVLVAEKILTGSDTIENHFSVFPPCVRRDSGEERNIASQIRIG